MKAVLHPARAVSLLFLFVIAIGTALLMLPMSTANGEFAPILVAAFTAVSAVCVTGLVVVDTGTYWSGFGQSIILLLFQLGGFGMMTAATLMGLMVNRSPRLRTRLITQVESHSIGLGDISRIAKFVLLVTVATELLICALLTLRLHFAYDLAWGAALWSGLFHSVSAFNNAGFSIHADSVVRYSTDFLFLMPLMAAIIVGGIGFPVLQDLRSKMRDPRHWSLHTKLTLLATLVLLLTGFFAILLFEWSNPATLGTMQTADKLLTAAFTSVSARTAGFNSVDIGALTHETWALHFLLMFIGGGSAGTAGGLKVGTAAVLALMVFAEVRGHSDSEAFGRRVGAASQRQAVTIVILGSAVVAVATIVLLSITNFPTDKVIFEVISAFGTVGLSTGITADFPAAGQAVLAALMFLGRVGTITLATSLILGERRMPYRYAEEHPIVG